MMTTLLTTAELEEATAALPFPRKATVEACAQWNAKIAVLEAQWAEWLKQESWVELPKSLRDEIFEKAWADGHSNGYDAVEEAYGRYADFAQSAIQAYQNERG